MLMPQGVVDVDPEAHTRTISHCHHHLSSTSSQQRHLVNMSQRQCLPLHTALPVKSCIQCCRRTLLICRSQSLLVTAAKVSPAWGIHGVRPMDRGGHLLGIRKLSACLGDVSQLHLQLRLQNRGRITSLSSALQPAHPLQQNYPHQIVVTNPKHLISLPHPKSTLP